MMVKQRSKGHGPCPPAPARRARHLWTLCVTGVAATICAALLWLYPFEPETLQRYDRSTILTDRHGVPLRIKLSPDDTDCRPISEDAVSDWVAKALIAAEDKRFTEHCGIDGLAILRAVCQNIFAGRRISGASTLSTQVIRLAEPRRRTLRTKIIEATKALQMERRLSKPQILEQWINRAPFGSNIIGVESASRMYFAKSAGDLSLPEAAILMGLPQSPSRLRPDRHPSEAHKRMQYVLRRMEACGFIDGNMRRDATEQVNNVKMHHRPFHAPHFCEAILQQKNPHDEVITSLDLSLQKIAERIVSTHCETLRSQGIFGAAVVVLDVRTGEVRAMIGSPDYFDVNHAGMVNGATARRSPGSALKSFVYAMALEQGMYTPASLIRDEPMFFADTEPVNFDGRFFGDVTIRESLVLSLNIPALKLTEEVGQAQVVHGLRELGMTTLDRPASDYGLGVALGSGEVTLLDLANAYACLAREGHYQPYSMTRAENQTKHDRDRPRFSPETCYMIADILGGDERNMDVFGHITDTAMPRFAWKTGTSSGFRDAWTIAWNPEYVVGVWVGNPDGSGSPALIGAQAAAPLAGNIFRTLYPDGNGPWFAMPPGIRTRILADGTRDLYVPGVSRLDVLSENEPVVQITQPMNGSTYRLTSNPLPPQQLALTANTDSALHWFIDGIHLGTTAPNQPLTWALKQGTWTISCSTEGGKYDHVTIHVHSEEAAGTPPQRSSKSARLSLAQQRSAP